MSRWYRPHPGGVKRGRVCANVEGPGVTAMNDCSTQSARRVEYCRTFMTFLNESEWAKRTGGPTGGPTGAPPRFDFVTGNPFEMPLPGIGAALAKASTPKHKDWFAYRM